MGSSGVGWWTATTAAACVAVLTLYVALVRSRNRHRDSLDERRWLLERERETAAVDAERARIAAELHDIVSHNVSLMVVQATAAREVLATFPDEAATAMAAVERAGRDTMTELRHLLGLLAPAADGDDAPAPAALTPQPTLARLGPLVDRIAFAGLPVEVRISGDPRPLPPGVDVTAYRIVQEALTNALRHSDRSGAQVTVRYADHSVRVEVLNGGPSTLKDETTARNPRATAGTGHGLLGLRERVALYGGYRVCARIPLNRPTKEPS